MGTPGDTAAAPARRSPYPRPWWVAVPRLILFFLFGGGLFYPVVLIQAIIRHTLLTTDRTLIDPRTLVWYVPLMAAGGWSLLDQLRESNAHSAQQLAELRHPELYGQRMLIAARAKDDRQAELNALGSIGFWLEVAGHYEEAKPYLDEALALARTLGNHPVNEERALYGLGKVEFERGDFDRAEDLFRECLAVATTLGVNRRDEIADTYAHIGEFLCKYRGKYEEGCQMLAQAQAIYHEFDHPDEQHMHDLRRQYGDERA